MTYSIVYSSKTGNTKMLADALHQALPADDCLYFGAPDAQALAAERIYIGFWTDKGTCDAETAAFLAQLKIIKRWGGAAQDDLSFVRVPTLIANGDNDAMVPTSNSNAMHEKIDGSRLVLYPHAGHGSLFQYPNEFAGEVNEFLG